MAIIQTTFDEIKAYIQTNPYVPDKSRSEALQALAKLASKEVADNTSFHSVVGFDPHDKPVFWDMKKGNLLAVSKVGNAIDSLGCTMVLVSLILRFSKKQMQYYLFTNDAPPSYLRENEHCTGSVSAIYDKNYNRYVDSFANIYDELKYRKTLSEEELARLPFLVIVFGNFTRYILEAGERFSEFYSVLLQEGTFLRVACMIATTRFENEPFYHRYPNSFPCRLAGNVFPATASELLISVPDRVVNENPPTKRMVFQDNKIQTLVQTHHFALGAALNCPIGKGGNDSKAKSYADCKIVPQQ